MLALVIVLGLCLWVSSRRNRRLRRENDALRSACAEAEASLERLANIGDMRIYTTDEMLASTFGLDKKSPTA